MQKAIWKFTLTVPMRCPVLMPEDAQILTVGVQGSSIRMWALVDPKAVQNTRYFNVYGTGHPHPGTGDYIGTAFIDELVFHVFEEKEPRS